ncbi:MAG: sigma 54-interacting transcriptional regulator [Spirochaetota bacterium]
MQPDKNDILNIILNSIIDGVFTVDTEFHITSINRAAEKIIGISKNDAIGRHCHEIFQSNICDYSCALKETITTGKPLINKTIYIIKKTGEKIPISINTAVLKDKNGTIIGGVETFRDISEITSLRKTLKSGFTFEDIVSKNRHMQELFKILPDIAESDSSVIIEGASGTGKELIAHAIHNLSKRNGKRLIPVNCAAIPDNLIESELFGYKAGAFTDAKKDKPGKIALAEGGTLFLDEIGELSINVQAKLLRFIQDKTYEPLGGIKPVLADVRIVAATNRNLEDEVKSKKFRQDLYYRLNVMKIRIPPLSERKEDIPLLIKHFIGMYNIIKSKNITGMSDDGINILMNHDFPGNIRELENIIEHSFILCKEHYIQKHHLPNYLTKESINNVQASLKDMEAQYIKKILKIHNWNRKETALALDIDKSTLWRKMKLYNIEEPQ